MALLWTIPILPLVGFLTLALLGRCLRRPSAGWIGTGSVGLAGVASLILAVRLLTGGPSGSPQPLWQWIRIEGLEISIGLALDPLSLLMILVVTIVGFLILVYATGFMKEDPGYTRFFGYMTLFVFSMLTLVLADNMILLFLGWEGVGLCSYLLIGFWYREAASTRAAFKAFLVTRIGDVAMLIGLLVLSENLGTLQIQEMLRRAAAEWPVGSPLAVTAALLLLGGAIGKSAQLPLQTWLPDAMQGPTPVSALIHSATMVTAGVYLLARVHILFDLAPRVGSLVAIIGVATLLMAGISAAMQRDIKRVLAYSTISQVGYMFLALGVGARAPAMFHFLTHAFFKSLLFLGAGVVIAAVGDEHDLFRMGGLRKGLPVTFWTFLVAGLSMAAFPPLSAGFCSKDWILYWVWSSDRGGFMLWLFALAGVFLTALYTFRLLFLVFFGPVGIEPKPERGATMLVPLVLLAIPAAMIGLLETPRTLGNVRLFSDFLAPVLPGVIPEQASVATERLLQILSESATLLGIVSAWLVVRGARRTLGRLQRIPAGPALHRFWASGWGFDTFYDLLLVRPYRFLATINRDDVFDLPVRGIAWAVRGLYRGLSWTQNGRLRRYVLMLAIGAIVLLALSVLR